MTFLSEILQFAVLIPAAMIEIDQNAPAHQEKIVPVRKRSQGQAFPFTETLKCRSITCFFH